MAACTPHAAASAGAVGHCDRAARSARVPRCAAAPAHSLASVTCRVGGHAISRAARARLSRLHGPVGSGRRGSSARVAWPTTTTCSSGLQSPSETSRPPGRLLLSLAAVLAVALASAAVYTLVPGFNQTLIDALAKSGFTAAFGLIFVSEIGDKTFFIAALLAMKRGKAVVMAGAVAALALMTGISVALGRLFTKLPDSLSSSLPVGEYCAVALLLFFGVKTLKDALAQPSAADAAAKSSDDERKEAAEVVQQAEASRQGGWLASFAQTFALIFVAEWGDRSMLATIALGAAQNPAGVFTGAVAGHALATALAVLGGAMLSERISERTVSITGGVMFLVFALATLLGVF